MLATIHPMKTIIIVSVILCGQANAQRDFSTRAYDVILEALGFGPCTEQPQRCGFRDRGYKMIKSDNGKGLCTEICSTMPYLNIGYQCGTCKVICPEDATVPCLQGIGLTLFRKDSNGVCDEICIIGSTQADGYSCGACENPAPTSPVPPVPVLPPTRQPITPVASPVVLPIPVSLPIAPTSIPSVDSPTSKVPVTSLPVANPTSSRYDITLQIVNVSTQDRAVFEAAAALWETSVVGDLPDVDSADFDSPPFIDGCAYPSTVDDLYICGTMTNIDGVGMVAGRARPTFLRTVDAGRLPSAGEMIFDLADIDDIRAKGLVLPLVAHEMGHVLGEFNNCNRNASKHFSK